MTFNPVYVPNRYRLIRGSGDGGAALTAFDRALAAAGVGDLNLVKITSILPPGAMEGSPEELPRGGVVCAAIGSLTSDCPGELLSAAVAVGIPDDPSKAGVIMEGVYRGGAADAEEKVRYMARQALEDRQLEMDRIESVSVELRVLEVGAVVAAVVLW